MTCEIGVANSDGYRSGGLCNLFSGSAVSVTVCKKGSRADGIGAIKLAAWKQRPRTLGEGSSRPIPSGWS